MLIFLQLLASCAAYKIVIFAPGSVNSQIMFNKRVAETLANAGHEVHVALLLQIEGLELKDVKFPKNVHVYPVNASIGITKREMEKKQSFMAFEDVQFWDKRVREIFSMSMRMMTESCRVLLQNKDFLKWLEDNHFDLAFVHMYHACPLGFPVVANIPSWIWLNSAALMDNVANIVGVPIFPSYVPPILMAAQDSMTFMERTKSFIGHALFRIIWPRSVANPETQVFRDLVDPNFPDLLEIGANCSLVMVNSNPLYDLPRPTLEKIVNIGGLGAQLKDAKPLPEDLESFVQKGEAAIVFSFGSVAPIHMAPESWKEAILGAFKRLPTYQVVMRYMGDDLNDRLPPNVKIMKWLPQSDLLQHPRIKAFISHGGYNGMQETIAAGKPIIMIPLFGDQPKNAKIGEKHGIAKILLKNDFTEENLYQAVKEVMTEKSYTTSVQRLSKMVQMQPVSSEQLLVKWTELLAEFKTLDNLKPASLKLNFFQYYSLDVIAFLVTIVAVVIVLLLLFTRWLLCKVYRKIVPKKEKTA